MPQEVLKCESCGNNMQREYIMDSGNSKFNVFKCHGCNKQAMRAIGVGR